MLRSIKSPQRGPRLLAFQVDGTGSSSIVVGSKDATLSKTATGRFVLTLEQPFARAPIAVGSVVYGASGLILSIESATASAISVRMYDAAGVDQDADFHLMVHGFDAADEY